jgi:hypothetical protein
MKGVILSHGSIIESAVGSRELFGPLDGRILQFANYTFDDSVLVSILMTSCGREKRTSLRRIGVLH